MSGGSLKDALHRALDASIKAHETEVLKGNCTDFADYKGKTGIIIGLRKSKVEIDDVFRKYATEDDSDE